MFRVGQRVVCIDDKAESSRFRSLVDDGLVEELLSRIIDEVEEEMLVEELAGIED